MCVSGWQLGRLVNKQQEEKKKRRKFRFPIYVCYTYVCVYNGKIFHRICTKMKKCSHSEMVWEMVDGICGWQMGGNNDDGEEKAEEGGQKQKNEIKRIRK